MNRHLFLLAALLSFVGIARSAESFSVKVAGSGPVLILIPGLACDGSVWDETVQRYQADYEIHTLSLAGFGATPPATLQDSLLQGVADELIAYIAENQLKRPTLVGHSLGGFLSLKVAAQSPDSVSKILIVDSLPFLPAAMNPNATVESMKPIAEGQRSQMSGGGQNEQALRMMLQMMITNPADIDRALAMALQSDPATVAQAMYELNTTDLRQAISRIETPTLVLGAWIAYRQFGSTQESTAAIFDSQYAQHPNYRLAMSDKGRHFIMWDDPDFFFSQLDSFLKSES